MAYSRVADISYIGADDVADLSDTGLLKKFKSESGLMSEDFNVIDSIEAGEGYTSWELERVSPTVVKHSMVWESETDFDTWKASYGEITPGNDWEVETLESAS